MQDLDRLGAQLAVQRAPVLVGQLAGPVVHLEVADLAVLRLARGLEVGAAALVLGALALGRAAAQRRR